MIRIDPRHLAQKLRCIARGGDIAQHCDANTAAVLPSVESSPQMLLTTSPRQFGATSCNGNRNSPAEFLSFAIQACALLWPELSPRHLQIVRSASLVITCRVDQKQKTLVLERWHFTRHTPEWGGRAVGPENGERRHGVAIKTRKRAMHVNRPPHVVVESRCVHENAAVREARQLAPARCFESGAQGIDSIRADQNVAVGGSAASGRKLLMKRDSLDVQHRSVGALSDQLQHAVSEAKTSANGHGRRELIHVATLGVRAWRVGPCSGKSRPLSRADRR